MAMFMQLAPELHFVYIKIYDLAFDILILSKQGCSRYSHMAGFMCHHKSRRETILMVESAAPYGMTHACDRSVT